MSSLRLLLASLAMTLALQGCYSSPAPTDDASPPPLLGGTSTPPAAELHFGDIVTFQQAFEEHRRFLGENRDGDGVQLAPSALAWEKWVLVNPSATGDSDSRASAVITFGSEVWIRNLRFDRFLGGDGAAAVKLAASPASWEKWKILDAANVSSTAVVKHSDTVLLQLVNFDPQQKNTYLNGDSGSKVSLGKLPSTWERWSIGLWAIDSPRPPTSLRYCDVITLRADYSRDYLGGRGDGGVGLARYPQAWERWRIQPEGTGDTCAQTTSTPQVPVKFGDSFVLKSVLFGRYLSGRDDNGVSLSARTEAWEKWTFVEAGANAGGEVSFQHAVNLLPARFAAPAAVARYLSARIDTMKGAPPIFLDGMTTYLGIDKTADVALSNNRLAWERWTLGKPADRTSLNFGDVVTIRSDVQGNYIGAHMAKSLPLPYFPQSWEQWRIVDPQDAHSTAQVTYGSTVLLHSLYFDGYLSADPGTLETSIQPNQLAWEKWQVVDFDSPARTGGIDLGAGVQLQMAQVAQRPAPQLAATRSKLRMNTEPLPSGKWMIRQVWYDPANWMSNLDGNTRLTQLTIPGTHDSGTYAYQPSALTEAKWPRNMVVTQSRSIAQQLQAGIRFLDIRVGKENGSFLVIHGNVLGENVRTSLWFGDVLQACEQFLRDNPTETILMSIKRDTSGTDDYFQPFVDLYYNRNSSLWYTGKAVPTLGEVRGKIVLMTRSGMNNAAMGIELGMNSNTAGKLVDIGGSGGQQLAYEDLSDPDQDSEKVSAISSHLQTSRDYLADPANDKRLFITFTTANRGGCMCVDMFTKGPRYYALDPVNINAWLLDHLYPVVGPVGIIPMDFPSDDLIWMLIGSNRF